MLFLRDKRGVGEGVQSTKESMQQQCYSSPLHSTSQRLSAALFLGAERCYGGGKSSVAAAYSPFDMDRRQERKSQERTGKNVIGFGVTHPMGERERENRVNSTFTEWRHRDRHTDRQVKD